MSDRPSHVDIAIIGAGIAGLTCARQLDQAGYTIAVIDKSRGVGGRVATRRLHNTCADHGASYLKLQGDATFQQFVKMLVADGILQVWTDAIHELTAQGELFPPPADKRYPRYAAPQGMTAIAKVLASDLPLCLSQRVHTLHLTAASTWQLQLEVTNPDSSTEGTITADRVIIAIPAPQALLLLAPLEGTVLASAFVEQVRSVTFEPCLSVIAGYNREQFPTPELEWQGIDCSRALDLSWIGLDSSKRAASDQKVLVIQSNAAFAKHHLEDTDLQGAGQRLLDRAASYLFPQISQPDWFQIHRWRYAFASSPLPQPYLIENLPESDRSPLICIGDWCGGNRIEHAFLSGLAAASAICDRRV